MKTKLWIPVTILIFSVAISGFARGPKEGMGKGRHPGMMGKFKLTDEQQEKIDALHLDLDKKLVPLKSELGIKQAELDALMVQENPSEKAVNGKIKEIGDLKTKMHTLMSGMVLKVRLVLTPEQRIQFDKRHMFMGGKMHGCGPEGRGMHGGAMRALIPPHGDCMGHDCGKHPHVKMEEKTEDIEE